MCYLTRQTVMNTPVHIYNDTLPDYWKVSMHLPSATWVMLPIKHILKVCTIL